MPHMAALKGAGPHPSSELSAQEEPYASPELISELAAARKRISLILTALVTGGGLLFALATGLFPQAMGREIIQGLSWMAASFFALVGFIFALVGFYVFWASRYYDSATRGSRR